MKNGRCSLFSVWDINAQTFGHSEVEGGEQECGRKPEPDIVIAAILAKKRIFGFSGIFSARCYGPRRSIFGSKSSIPEPNIPWKFQGPSLNTTYFCRERLSIDEWCRTCVRGHIQPPISRRQNSVFQAVYSTWAGSPGPTAVKRFCVCVLSKKLKGGRFCGTQCSLVA